MGKLISESDVQCIACGAAPSQNAHIISQLYLKRHGIPARLVNEQWNIVPVCFECHQIYDLLDWEGRHNRGRRSATTSDQERLNWLNERLLEKRKAAEAAFTELLAHVRHWDIHIGDEIEGTEVTSFDITQIRNQTIRVYTYKNEDS